MDIEMELSRILIRETADEQIIVLSERNGERSFPIAIGLHEAIAIQRRLNGFRTPRPLTHDLIHNVITEMGGRLERIIVNDLRDQTFYAQLIIATANGTVKVDARPSDAIALGISHETPIFVADHVLDLET